jgi:cysteine desulfurase/selenocysteine lyase
MTEALALAAVRADFPVSRHLLYLDSAHQTPLASSVRTALEAFYREGNEMAGPKARWLQRVEVVRSRVGSLIGAAANEIAFTKNTSEGLNIAANAIPLRSGDNVLLIDGDHPNNAYAWLNLRRKGVEVRFISLPVGQAADANTFAAFIDDRTRVISLSHITFHAGQRSELVSLGRLCRARGIRLVVDAMQSVGVVPIDVKEMNISMLAAGCHKGLLVPQGLGILYVDEALEDLAPVYLAVASLANPPADLVANPDDLTLRTGAGRFELGNHNLPAIHALAASLDLLEGVGIACVEEHVLSLGDRLISHLDEHGVGLVGPRERSMRAHIYTLDLPAGEWLPYFERSNVRVSPERDGIRISFGVFNTMEEVDRVAQIIKQRG